MKHSAEEWVSIFKLMIEMHLKSPLLLGKETSGDALLDSKLEGGTGG